MGAGKFWWIALGALVGLLLFLVIGANAWWRAFLSSDAFRELVADKVGDLWQVDGAFSDFRWQGWTVYIDNFQAFGRPDSKVAHLRAQRIRASLAWRELLRGTWQITSLQIGLLEVETRSAGETQAATSSPPAPSSPGLPAWIPQKFQLLEAKVESASWVFPGGSLRGSTWTIHPVSNGWSLQSTNGSLQLPHLPANQLETAQLRWFSSGWFLTRGRLSFREGGSVEASGELGREKWQLQTKWQDLPTEKWLPARTRDFLRGTWSVVADSEGTVGEPLRAARTEGTFSLQDGEMRDLPMFRALATFTRSRQFERVPLHEFTGRFVHKAGATAFSDLVLESRGLVRMVGEVDVAADGQLQGDLRAGLTAQTLQWIPGSEKRVFTERDGGYLWTGVRLEGTLEHPREDLTRRLVLAGGEEVLETGTRTIQHSTETAVEGIRSVLDTLLPLLP